MMIDILYISLFLSCLCPFLVHIEFLPIFFSILGYKDGIQGGGLGGAQAPPPDLLRKNCLPPPPPPPPPPGREFHKKGKNLPLPRSWVFVKEEKSTPSPGREIVRGGKFGSPSLVVSLDRVGKFPLPPPGREFCQKGNRQKGKLS